MSQKPYHNLVVMLTGGVFLAMAGSCLGQSNPLLPAGVGSGSDLSYGYSRGGTPGLGRGKGPVPQGGDENPAETLLRKMDGTNYGHHTGHAYFRGRPVYDAGRFERSSNRAGQTYRTTVRADPRRQSGSSNRSSTSTRSRNRYRPGPSRPAARTHVPDLRLYY